MKLIDTTRSTSTAAAQIWSTVHVVRASSDDRRMIAELATKLTADSQEAPAEYARQAKILGGHLPLSVRENLFGLDCHGDGALLITGLDVGPIPATPSSPAGADGIVTRIAHTVALMVSATAQLVGYRAESGGRLLQSIVPTEADRYRQTSTGSVALESHTEQGFNTCTRPAILALGCNRGDPDAATYVMSARTLTACLSGSDVALLREPRYFTRVDPSFVDGGVADKVRGPIAVLAGPSDDPILTYDEDLMWSCSPAHQQALDRVRDVWSSERARVVLHPGHVLLIDNSRAIHGRSEYRPKFDGGDRWLIRAQGIRTAGRPMQTVIGLDAC